VCLVGQQDRAGNQSDAILRAAGTMEPIVGLSVTMLVLATLVMAIGAALQAAVGLGLALFVVPLLALIAFSWRFQL
jgi:hypothetical protein